MVDEMRSRDKEKKGEVGAPERCKCVGPCGMRKGEWRQGKCEIK